MIEIEDADKSFESCQDCVHAYDSTEICILRRCIHAFSELRECYKPKKELKPSAQPVDKDIDVPITDTISRQAVYNVLDKMPVRGFKKDGETIHGLISLSQVNSAIINLPSALPEPHWIPCSERLPDKAGYYLITAHPTYNHDLDIRIAFWHRRFIGYAQSEIIAWMSLPEPYREEEVR